MKDISVYNVLALSPSQIYIVGRSTKKYQAQCQVSNSCSSIRKSKGNKEMYAYECMCQHTHSIKSRDSVSEKEGQFWFQMRHFLAGWTVKRIEWSIGCICKHMYSILLNDKIEQVTEKKRSEGRGVLVLWRHRTGMPKMELNSSESS